MTHHKQNKPKDMQNMLASNPARRPRDACWIAGIKY